jgi:hypothetical protein
MKAYMGKKILICFDPLDLHLGMFEQRSGIHCSFEDFQTFTHFVLGHHTSTSLLPSIMAQGLLPHYDKGRAIKDNLDSEPESVYLSTELDRVYFRRSTKKNGGKGLIILVEVSLENLEPDENALSLKERGILPKDRHLFESMLSGSCRHKGPIYPDQFRGMYADDGTAV